MKATRPKIYLFALGLAALVVAAFLWPSPWGPGAGPSVAEAAPVLSLDAGCTPDAIRPNELAVIECWNSVTNLGDATASNAWFLLQIAPGMNSPSFFFFDCVVDGERVWGVFSEGYFGLPDVAPGQTVETSCRVIVSQSSEGAYGAQLDLLYEGDVVDSALQSFDVAAGAAHPPADLSVSKMPSTLDQEAGTGTYELLVFNSGDTTVNDVAVQDKHSRTVVLVSADPPVTEADDVTHILTWEVGPLDPGEELRIQATFEPAHECAFFPTNLMIVTAEVDGTMEDYAAADWSDIIIGSDDCIPPTPQPTPTPGPVPPLTGSMLLALGDSVMEGCCGDPNDGVAVLFNTYLSERHSEEMALVNLAANFETAEGFINRPRTWPSSPWPSGREGTQLEEAVAVLGDAAANGVTVRAITLDIGGNDFLFLYERGDDVPCYVTASEACVLLFRERLVTYRADLDTILGALVEAKDPDTPILFMNYYNPFDTGEGTPLILLVESVIGQINLVIAEAAEAHGAYLVDTHPLFAGQAATLVEGVDPTPAGHQVLADAFAAAYEAYLLSRIDATPTATSAAPPTPTAVATAAQAVLPPETGTGGGAVAPAAVPLASAAALAASMLALAWALGRRAA